MTEEQHNEPLLSKSLPPHSSQSSGPHTTLSPKISWNIPLLQAFNDGDIVTHFPVSLEEVESVGDQLNELDRLDGVYQPRKQLQRSKHSLETLDTSSESSSSFQSRFVPVNQARTIRWADEHDLPLATSQTIGADTNRRIVLLLVHPIAHRFEFLHLEYDTTERTSISDLLARIPQLCSCELFQSLSYSALYRRHEKQRFSKSPKLGTPRTTSSSSYTELICALSCEDYDLGWNEILLAATDSFDPQDLQARATQLLECAALQKVVRKAKFTGRALQRMTSSPPREKPNSKASFKAAIDPTTLLIPKSDELPLSHDRKSDDGNCSDDEINPDLSSKKLADEFSDSKVEPGRAQNNSPGGDDWAVAWDDVPDFKELQNVLNQHESADWTRFLLLEAVDEEQSLQFEPSLDFGSPVWGSIDTYDFEE